MKNQEKIFLEIQLVSGQKSRQEFSWISFQGSRKEKTSKKRKRLNNAKSLQKVFKGGIYKSYRETGQEAIYKKSFQDKKQEQTPDK